jgi:hypothetical protein
MNTDHESDTNTIPEDLTNSYNASKTLVLISELLHNVPYAFANKVTQALTFVHALHRETIASVLAHPQADLIDEIKKYKESLNGGDKKITSKETPDSGASSTL